MRNSLLEGENSQKVYDIPGVSFRMLCYPAALLNFMFPFYAQGKCTGRREGTGEPREEVLLSNT